MTQGPGDLLYMPPGFVIVERVQNNTDVLGLKLVMVPKTSEHAVVCHSLMASFVNPSEAAPKAMLALLSKFAAPANAVVDAKAD
mmetsp:Transcript_41680/g.134765  ORF Transcript_41680/g.134765 Transcript_41680/m.134765 type:complete len:84 (+) Transcript_41680:2837-3088(+)